MKKMILSVVAVLVLVCGAGGFAWGSLVGGDFLDPGDGLLTFDSETGLEWLDLDQTINMSYDSVVNDPEGYVQKFGFRYATSDDLYDLYLHTFADPVDLPSSEIYLGPPNSYYYYENLYEVQTLLNLMSVTAFFGDYQGVYGLYDNRFFEEGMEKIDFAVVGLNEHNPVAVLWITGDKSSTNLPVIGLTESMSFYGSYLVRDASSVPLPGAVVFLGSGLIALIGARRRFGKK